MFSQQKRKYSINQSDFSPSLSTKSYQDQQKNQEFDSHSHFCSQICFSDQLDSVTSTTYQEHYQNMTVKLHMILRHTKTHLEDIKQRKAGPDGATSSLAYVQLQQTPKMQEISVMLVTALEKLFQAIEYVKFPIKEDLMRRNDIQLAENLCLNQINDQIKKLRRIMTTDMFYVL